MPTRFARACVCARSHRGFIHPAMPAQSRGHATQTIGPLCAKHDSATCYRLPSNDSRKSTRLDRPRCRKSLREKVPGTLFSERKGSWNLILPGTLFSPGGSYAESEPSPRRESRGPATGADHEGVWVPRDARVVVPRRAGAHRAGPHDSRRGLGWMGCKRTRRLAPGALLEMRVRALRASGVSLVRCAPRT